MTELVLKPLSGIIHYDIPHGERQTFRIKEVKPYRKIVVRILNTHVDQFRKLLSIPDNQKFKCDAKVCNFEKYDWDGCPEYDPNEHDIYRIHPNCQFVFYTEMHYNSFIEKSGFVISKKAKTHWYPNSPDRNIITEKGTYGTFEKCNPQYPIYIPTFQRHETCYTARTLEDLDIENYYLVIRNDETEITNYKKAIKNFKLKCKLLIIKNEFYEEQKKQGNDYSIIPRNYAYEHAINNGFSHHWCIDDNIKGFFRRNNGVILEFKNTGYPLYFVEEYMKKYNNLYQCGIQYRHLGFAMGHRNPIIYNSRIYSCILIKHIDGFKWRGKYNEDTDLSIRLLKSGYSTMTFQNILCGKQGTSSVKGGNTDAFHKTEMGYTDKANSLKDQHPDITKVIIKYNRPHHHVDYSGFAENELDKTDYKLNLPEMFLLED